MISGSGVRHREDHRPIGHALHHLLRDEPRLRKADEDVASDERVFEGTRVGVGDELFLVLVQTVRTSFVHDAAAVGHQDVLALDAEILVELGARNRRRTGAREHDLDLVDLLVLDLETVQQRGGGDDRGAVLVVVEDGDVEGFLELLFDLEAFRSADVLEVDAAEGRRDHLAEADDLLRVLAVDLDVEHVDVREALEENALAFHHGLAGERADVAEAEHGAAVAQDGDEVALRRVLVRILGILVDLEARRRDARGVGEREVFRGHAGLRRDDLDFAGAAVGVVIESVVVEAHCGDPLARHADGLASAGLCLREAVARTDRRGMRSLPVSGFESQGSDGVSLQDAARLHRLGRAVRIRVSQAVGNYR